MFIRVTWLDASHSVSKGWCTAIVQLVEALRCKPEGRGFDSRLTLFSGRTVGSTQPLTEMCTRDLPLEVKAAGA